MAMRCKWHCNSPTERVGAARKGKGEKMETSISDLGCVYAWQDESGWHYTDADNSHKSPASAQQARLFAEVEADGGHTREWIALGFAGDGLEIELSEFEYVR